MFLIYIGTTTEQTYTSAQYHKQDHNHQKRTRNEIHWTHMSDNIRVVIHVHTSPIVSRWRRRQHAYALQYKLANVTTHKKNNKVCKCNRQPQTTIIHKTFAARLALLTAAHDGFVKLAVANRTLIGLIMLVKVVYAFFMHCGATFTRRFVCTRF